MSDGSSLLYFLDPTNFQITGHIQVHDNNGPVSGLNELEHIRGHIYANIWGTDRIAIIDPGNGQVSGRIDLAGLLEAKYRTNPVDILNGIAYDAVRNRLFVTGKLWPVLFEIEAISLPAKRP
jgi:glutamine cyclotransferase